MSSLSPEFRAVPEILGQLSSGSVLRHIVSDIIFQRSSPRNFLEDAGIIALHNEVKVEGITNIPSEGGVLLVFNHPYLNTLLPALMNLAVDISTKRNRSDFTLVMASEFRLSGNHADRHLPGSPAFFRGIGKLYPTNIILVPQKKTRGDYDSGRESAALGILRALIKGRIVAISPEGQIERDGTIIDPEEFQSNVGGIARIAAKRGIAIIPVGIWKDQDRKLHVKLGHLFNVQSQDDDQKILREMMSAVQSLIESD